MCEPRFEHFLADLFAIDIQVEDAQSRRHPFGRNNLLAVSRYRNEPACAVRSPPILVGVNLPFDDRSIRRRNPHRLRPKGIVQRLGPFPGRQGSGF